MARAARQTLPEGAKRARQAYSTGHDLAMSVSIARISEFDAIHPMQSNFSGQTCVFEAAQDAVWENLSPSAKSLKKRHSIIQ